MAPAVAPPLAETMHPRPADLTVLLEVARSMAAVTELDRLLEFILEAARRVLSADRATLFLYDPVRHELYGRIVQGQQGGEIRFPADRGIAGAAAMGRVTINIPDVYADPRFNRDVDRSTGYRTRCLLTVPLTGIEGQLVGVVQALNKNAGVFDEYDVRLAEALAAQVGVALQRARLMEHYVVKKQLESSLAIARSIQQGLLPKFPPQIPGYEVAALSRPADETGGDSYDFAPLPAGRWAFSIADASGHGIGPALVVSETRALLRAMLLTEDRPDELLARTNRLLCADLTEGRFVTVFLGVLDPAGHVLRHSSAGHGPLFWYRAADRSIRTTAADGLPLGLMEDLDYPAGEAVRFEPGDVGLLLTDGYIEAMNPDDDTFGEERMTELLRRHAGRPAAELLRAMDEEVDRHRNGAAQSDDLTAVVIKRTV